ncbi:MAG TPA: alpha/beta fold hydrolase [Acidimicrobiales bacterium]|nr:alpha/beta fold hydrolase [Acidimicrobiales bacterium]
MKLLRAAAADKKVMSTAAQRLSSFTQPVLIVWASEDRVMPPKHAPRLARLLPQARLTELADSYTLLPLDQPKAFARAIADFAAA